MNELWVAREQGNTLSVFESEPSDWSETEQIFRGGGWVDCIDPEKFPSLLPGQCRRLVMESEASE